MNNTDNINNVNGTIPEQQTGAVSIYGDVMDDFPVLKAFQQYVDAEQAKAHKRLMTVCIFFTVVMTIVIAVFMFIILGLNNGNVGNDGALKALSESNAAIQRQMLEQSAKMNEQLMRELSNRNSAPQTPAPSTIDAEIQKQNLALQVKLHQLELEKKLAEQAAAEAKARAENGPRMSDDEKTALEKKLKEQAEAQRMQDKKLKEREAKIAEESKRLKEKEIDLQRRKLYPDAYSPEARAKADREIEEANRKSKEAEANARIAEEKALSEIRRIEAANMALEAKLREAEARAKKAEQAAAERATVVHEDAAPADPLAVHPVKPTKSEYGAKPVVQTDGTLRFYDDEETRPASKKKPKKPAVRSDADIDEIPDFPEGDPRNNNPDADIDAIPDVEDDEYDIPVE